METSPRFQQLELLKTQLENPTWTVKVSERLRRDAVIHLLDPGHIFTAGSCDVSGIEASNKLAESDLKEMLRYKEMIVSVGKKCVLTFCCQTSSPVTICVTLGSCWRFCVLAVASCLLVLVSLRLIQSLQPPHIQTCFMSDRLLAVKQSC